MTRKDYITIAAQMRALRPVQNQAYYGHWCADTQTLNATAHRLCAVFAADNPRFDRAKFLTACGV